MKASQKKLIAVIQASIAADPYPFHDDLWCRLSHAERAKRAGVSEKTVQRLIGKPPGIPPFVSVTVRKAGATLVRVGEPGPHEHLRGIQIQMRNVWRDYLRKHVPAYQASLRDQITSLKEQSPKPVEAIEEIKARLAKTRLHETPKEFGLLLGLAKDWPDGAQVDMFKLIIQPNNWTMFMTGVKIVHSNQRRANKEALEKDPTAKVTDPRSIFFDFPHLPTLRKYWKVAIDVLETHYQATQKTPPPAFKALNPHLWTHMKP